MRRWYDKFLRFLPTPGLPDLGLLVEVPGLPDLGLLVEAVGPLRHAGRGARGPPAAADPRSLLSGFSETFVSWSIFGNMG